MIHFPLAEALVYLSSIRSKFHPPQKGEQKNPKTPPPPGKPQQQHMVDAKLPSGRDSQPSNWPMAAQTCRPPL